VSGQPVQASRVAAGKQPASAITSRHAGPRSLGRGFSFASETGGSSSAGAMAAPVTEQGSAAGANPGGRLLRLPGAATARLENEVGNHGCRGAPARRLFGRTTDASVARDLQRLVSALGGPIGAIATLYRNGRTTGLRAEGRRDPSGAARWAITCASPTSPRRSVAPSRCTWWPRARLGLDDTIRQQLPGMMPPAWSAVTCASCSTTPADCPTTPSQMASVSRQPRTRGANPVTRDQPA
jgi:hypothetical protein